MKKAFLLVLLCIGFASANAQNMRMINHSPCNVIVRATALESSYADTPHQLNNGQQWCNTGTTGAYMLPAHMTMHSVIGPSAIISGSIAFPFSYWHWSDIQVTNANYNCGPNGPGVAMGMATDYFFEGICANRVAPPYPDLEILNNCSGCPLGTTVHASLTPQTGPWTDAVLVIH